jgi:hypothetical protein
MVACEGKRHDLCGPSGLPYWKATVKTGAAKTVGFRSPNSMLHMESGMHVRQSPEPAEYSFDGHF